jgi:2-polyprenyl-6-methoxyphenol hydroxylase-like FAD-dependent oxidoreductase
MYDVIIVGARVAGSATAMLLARQGLKVLAVDRATFPSDTLSTHQVQVPGVARLARWGVLDAVLAAGTPPTRSVRFDQGQVSFAAPIPAGGGADLMCSPRRTLLDKVLVDAARAAGAQVRENFIAEGLLVDDGLVTGIRGRLKGGPEVTEQARLIVGADGKHSMVATAVGAPRYRVRPPRTMAYYTYWAEVAMTGGEMYGRPGYAVGAWPTGDGLVMTYLAWPVSRHAAFRLDVEGNFLRCLDGTGLGERVRAGRRAERFRGTPDLPSFFRKPYGPGWALAGDAGLVMDPITGQGISDAFRDAELLTEAIMAGFSGALPLARALAGYQDARDRAVRPMYDFTAQLAQLAAPRPAELALFEALARSPQDASQFVGALTGAVPLRQFMSARNMIRLVGLRGFARLIAGQARPARPAGGEVPAALSPAAGA